MDNITQFSIYGRDTIRIYPYDSAKAPIHTQSYPREHWHFNGIALHPRILSLDKSNVLNRITMCNLHQLLFAQNSNDVTENMEGLVLPLDGYEEGQEISIFEIGNKLLETANLSGRVRGMEDRDPTRGVYIESAADWVYKRAENALIGLTGVEGVLALLRSQDIWRIDKDELGVQAFSPEHRNALLYDMHWDTLREKLPELDRGVLKDALNDESLASYANMIESHLSKH